MSGLNELNAHEAAQKIRDHEITSEALVQDCLDRIADSEQQVHAWQYLDNAAALDQARTRDTTPVRGLLHGVPVGIKDLINTGDMPTCYGSSIYAGHRPVSDAECVKRLREAGAVILGKTVTTEFAAFNPALTRNPHNLSRTPGGSSSGSAAAVADGMVPLALGTQTAGSVIRPAAFCGVVGFKPSFDYLSTTGIKPLSGELDTLGVFARNTKDAALVTTCLRPRSSALMDITRKPAPVGLFRGPHWGKVDESSKAMIEKLWGQLGAAKSSVIEQDPMHDFAELSDIQHTIMCADMAKSLAPEFNYHSSHLSEGLRKLIEYGLDLGGEKVLAARARAHSARVKVEKLFGECRLLITPSASGEAPGVETTGDPLFNKVWTLLHLPCLSVPIGHGPNGLPISIQVVARANEEATLINGGGWIERILADSL